ncbi:MAG: hypothetical protein JWM95_4040 [Gemmatimonadetes bacterium]|nr:hypothetical protein [Gemmatimonadota bacterium]
MPAPSLLGAFRPTSVDVRADATSRTSLRITAAYLALTTLPLARWCFATERYVPLAVHVAILGVALALLLSRGGYVWLRDWIPLLLGPLLYVELGWIIAGSGAPHWDSVAWHWEAAVFPGDPSRSLADRWSWVWLSEILHACYLSYYVLVFLPPAILWLRGRRRESTSTILALVLVFALCFVAFIVFPVDGPRFVRGAAPAPAGPVRSFVLWLLAAGSSRGTAFPSSHVAAGMVATLLALRYQRTIGYVTGALTVGLALGAVYGGYHYAVDVVAGIIAGGLATVISQRLES